MRRIPFHPLLFATFPLLFLFVENSERVRLGKVVQPGAVVLLSVVVVTALAFVLYRPISRAAIVGSGLAVLALSYGHLYTALQDNAVFGFVYGRDLVLVPVWGLLGVGVLVFARRARSLPEITGILNIVAFGLVAVSAFNTGTAVANQEQRAFQANVGKRSEEIPKTSGAGTQRDVYYLIFDRYGSERVLDEYLAFDNSTFTDALRKRGFFVASDSVANYPKTAHSLASSMNMSFLDHLAEGDGASSEDWKPLYLELVDPEVPRFLRAQGYRYAHVGSWYDPTASDPTAHINYHYDKRSEFTRVLIETTIAHPLAKRVGFLKDLDGRQVAHNQILFQFESILDAAELPGPTFTFAHILLPHEPFTFDADGAYVSEDVQGTRTYERLYTDQVKYANRRILELLDRLLDVPDEEKPIIVVQADEGPDKGIKHYGGRLSWSDAPDGVLEQKLGILNAYHLPGVNDPSDAGIDRSITPVNSFRMIFNHYFGTDLERLPDSSYAYGTGAQPYRFEDVTDRLRIARAAR